MRPLLWIGVLASCRLSYGARKLVQVILARAMSVYVSTAARGIDWVYYNAWR